MNKNKGALSTSILESTTNIPEVEALLSELLPHTDDQRSIIPAVLEPVSYMNIHRITLPSGIRAVRLPDGRTIAKALDRRSGKIFWIPVRC